MTSERVRALKLLMKISMVWLLLMVSAIGNGLLRDKILVPAIGAEMALPASGITLSLLILLLSWFLVPLIVNSKAQALVTGALWVVLTLSFEYLFGYYVLEKTLAEIHQVFALAQGNLFVLALFTCAVAPWLVARIRGIG